jgi:general secretion pathway protein L
LASVPDGLPVLAEPAVAGLAEQALQRPVTLQQAAQRHLQAAQSPWDLAQFDLASSGRSPCIQEAVQRWAGLLRAPQWRAARWGLVALVLANLVGPERLGLDGTQRAQGQARCRCAVR